MKLSQREELLWKELNKKGVASLDTLHEVVRKIEERPEVARQSVNAAVKSLAYKMSQQGIIIERATKTGRGAKAIYRLRDRKKAAAFS